MINLKGIFFLGFTGLGALAGAILSLLVLALGAMMPGALGWACMPIVGGVVIGAVVGIMAEMYG